MLAAEGVYPLALLPLALVLMIAFVWVEKRASQPLLEYSLFKRRLMWISSLLGVCLGIQMFSILSYLPLYCQGVLRSSPTQAGGVVTALVFGGHC